MEFRLFRLLAALCPAALLTFIPACNKASEKGGGETAAEHVGTIQPKQHGKAPVATPADAGTDERLKVLVEKISPDTRISFMKFDDTNIDGASCAVYASGQHTPERFIREDHYAVCPDDKVYIMNYLDGEYMPYETYLLKKKEVP